MSKFSERMGLTKSRIEFQVNSIDDALKNCLWNELYNHYFQFFRVPQSYKFMKLIWASFFKLPIDSLRGIWKVDLELLRGKYFSMEWFVVYDFIEFAANNYPTKVVNDNFIKACNNVLEDEKSAYRFVGTTLTPITSEFEIAEIDEALLTPMKTVNAHIENALKLLSDRQAPDYRNSIKESISAVEAMCRLIVGKDNATLGAALDIIKRDGKIELHGAMREAFDHLYGFASSADGIRHAFSDEKISTDFDEAKFMLVACSAFVNYLISKASKAGLQLG